jgi:selenocysteine-specific elongation factor
LANLDRLVRGTPSEILIQAMLALGIAPLQDVITRSNLDLKAADEVVKDLTSSGQLLVLENSDQNILSPQSLVISKPSWDMFSSKVLKETEEYHKNYPLRRGIPREELKSRMKISARFYNAILRKIVAAGDLVEVGALIHRTGHNIQFNPQQKRSVDDLLAKFAGSPFSPPTVKECLALVGEDIYNAMIELGILVPVPPDLVFRKQDFELMVSEITGLLKSKGKITAAEVRDHFNTSRRYVLSLLEYLDSLGVTVREGDFRRLK